MARNAIFGTYTYQINLLPHYAVCFALVTAIKHHDVLSLV